MKNGVPFDVAFAMQDQLRKAFAIVFSEQEGAIFDWQSMKFEERK